MQVLRTDESCFVNLADYPFEANWFELELETGVHGRMHYLDEGDVTAPAVILLHGEPSWSYLYRKMIPPLLSAGLRVLAPDLIGFGKSDKPDDIGFYTYHRHVEWVEAWRQAIVPQTCTLFCQDWGGLIGLRMVAHAPDSFRAVIASNTFLPDGGNSTEAFLQWREFARTTPVFPVSDIINRGTVSKLSADEKAAYDAPFPSEAHKAGARAFPLLVPIDRSDPSAVENREKWQALASFERPFLTLFGDSDPVTEGLDRVLQNRISGAKCQAHRILESCGHFCQEDAAEELAAAIISIA